jgi:hypothetical protein
MNGQSHLKPYLLVHCLDYELARGWQSTNIGEGKRGGVLTEWSYNDIAVQCSIPGLDKVLGTALDRLI